MSRFGDWIRSLRSKKSAPTASEPGIRAQNNAAILNDDKVMENDEDTTTVPLLGSPKANNVAANSNEGAGSLSLVDWIKKKREEECNKQYENLYSSWSGSKTSNAKNHLNTAPQEQNSQVNLKNFIDEAYNFTSKKSHKHETLMILSSLIFFYPSTLYHMKKSDTYDILKENIEQCGRAAGQNNDKLKSHAIASYTNIEYFLRRKHDNRHHFWGINCNAIAAARAVRQRLAIPMMDALISDYHEHYNTVISSYNANLESLNSIKSSVNNENEFQERKKLRKSIGRLLNHSAAAAEIAQKYINTFAVRFENAKKSERIDDIEFCNWFRARWSENENDSDKIIKNNLINMWSKPTDVNKAAREVREKIKCKKQSYRVYKHKFSKPFVTTEFSTKKYEEVQKSVNQLNRAIEDWKKYENRRNDNMSELI